MQKLFDDFFSRFEEISLHCENMDTLSGIMGCILSAMGGIVCPKF